MNAESPPPLQPNTLGKASLILGIVASTFLVCTGLCAGVGDQQGWLQHVGPVLLVLAGTFAFMGLLSVLLGVGGLFGRNRPKSTAFIGLLLGVITVALFAALVNAAR